MTESNDQPSPPSQPEWFPPVPGSTWDPGIAAPMAPPEVALAPMASTKSSSSPKRWIAIGGAAALLAAGGFAVASLAGGGAKGGAESPQAAINGLVASLNDEDMIGAMDFVLPGERRVLKDPLIDMVGELARLEVLSGEATLDKVAGFDIEIDIALVEVDEVADDISVIDLTGTSTVSVDQAEVPLGDFLVDEMLDGERPNDTSTSTAKFGGDAGDAPRFATVKRDGRWYVSLFYTIAEQVRGDAELPDADEAIAPVGAKNPEEAVLNLLDAVEDTDLEGIIATLNPDEASALQRYAPLFVGDGQDSIDQLISDGEMKLRIGDPTFETSTDGDRARVSITSFTAEATSAGEKVRLTFEDGCATIELPDQEPTESCSDDTKAQLDDLGLGSLSSRISKDMTITVAKSDGQWYVSPIGSVFDGLLAVMRAFERSDIEEAISSISDFGLGAFDTSIDPMNTDDPFGTEETFDTMDETFDTMDETFDTMDPNDPFTIVNDCLYGDGVDDSTACLDAALADGRIAESDIPAAVRFPECMGDEYYMTIYEATDAEFTELVTAAGSCFAGHVAAGEIEEYAVPYDVVAPECYEGKNPYILEGDAMSAAFEAYFDCLNAG